MRGCRIGLVGAGNVADRHARVLSRFDDVTLVGVTDVVPDAALRLAQRYDVPVFQDLDGLLGAAPDAVYLCVPPFAHGVAEEAVLDADIPIFVEKPIAGDLPTAARLAALVAGRVCSPPSGTTGATCPWWSRPGGCWPTGRYGWSGVPGWTRCHRCPGGPGSSSPGVRWSNRPPTYWT